VTDLSTQPEAKDARTSRVPLASTGT
jgi:hypothetical protein